MSWRRRGCLWLIAVSTSAPALASFDLSYVGTGRIWVPALDAQTSDLTRTNRTIALMDFAQCDQPERQPLLEARERDCRFERQLAQLLTTSGMFERVIDGHLTDEKIDFILVPRRSRVEFQRRAIPIVKPLLWLTLFTYLWTPLPYESDTESYELTLALLDRARHWLEDVTVDHQATHYLGTYSADRHPPADLVSAMDPVKASLGITVCTGPHAAAAVHELLQKVGGAIAAHSAARL